VIPLSEISNGLRKEGLNYGVPTTFVVLGGTNQIQMEDLLEEILKKSTKRGWVCLVGKDFDPLSMGIGTLVRGLSQLQRFVEVETDGLHRDPRWAYTVDRWIVRWTSKSVYNLGSLRATDSIKFEVTDETSLEEIQDFLDGCSSLTPVRYLVTSSFGEITSSMFDLVRKYERSRIY